MDEQKMPRRPRRSSTEEQPKNESLVYGKNPVTFPDQGKVIPEFPENGKTE